MSGRRTTPVIPPFTQNMRRFTLTLLGLLILSNCLPVRGEGNAPETSSRDAPATAEADVETLAAYLRESGKPPVDYLTMKLKSHDLILLGETHRIADNCVLIARNLAPLYHKAGLRIFLTEFINSSKNDQLHQLVTANEFDSRLAVDLMRDYGTGIWGFQEYLDILRAAWQLNHELPEDAERLRVVGIDNDWGSQPPTRDRSQQFQNRLAREQHMIGVVRDHALQPGRKSLVHIGRDHTYTNHGVRLGTVLAKEADGRLFQVVLHHQYPCKPSPGQIESLLDRVVASAADGAVGFDLMGSPFADLQDPTCMYWMMMPETGLGDIMQGYIYLRPAGDLRSVSWIEGFINTENFDRAKRFAAQVGWIEKEAVQTPRELDAVLSKRFPPHD